MPGDNGERSSSEYYDEQVKRDKKYTPTEIGRCTCPLCSKRKNHPYNKNPFQIAASEQPPEDLAQDLPVVDTCRPAPKRRPTAAAPAKRRKKAKVVDGGEGAPAALEEILPFPGVHEDPGKSIGAACDGDGTYCEDYLSWLQRPVGEKCAGRPPHTDLCRLTNSLY